MQVFETPSLRAALETAKDNLLETQRNLETMRTKCNCLQEQIVAKENFFTKQELALKEASERELEQSEWFFFIIKIDFGCVKKVLIVELIENFLFFSPNPKKK